MARGPERFSNRELSWLEFGARLLDLADDERTPLLERVKFLAIFSEGLDEFFQVRVAGLKDQVDAGLRTRSADGLRPSEALRAIGDRVTELVDRQSRIFLDPWCPRWPRPGSGWRTGPRSTTTTATYLTEVFQPPDLPGPHPAVGRPRPPLPLHLQPVAQPHRAGRRSRHRGRARGPGEGPAAAAALRGHARRRALRGPGAGHRRPPGDAVPRHGDRRALRLPGDAQRRPRARRGRGRRPAGRGRDGAAPAPLRTGRAPRGRGRDLRRHARHAGARARPRARRPLRHRGAARPRRPVGRLRARPPRPPRGGRGRP